MPSGDKESLRRRIHADRDVVFSEREEAEDGKKRKRSPIFSSDDILISLVWGSAKNDPSLLSLNEQED
jgi:hypothetical protein